MKCPVCQTEMVLELTKDGSKWWWCGVCEDEEPYTEFDQEEETDEDLAERGYSARIREEE